MNSILREVSDLEWLLSSPDLLSSSIVAQQLGDSWLDSNKLVGGVKASEVSIAPIKYRRLGHYFERLVFLYLMHHPDYQLTSTNFQVIDNKHTLGEFDAILQDSDAQKYIHLELAVKFYLQLNDGHVLSDWVGSSLQDRLDLKYQHLLSHQLQLSNKITQTMIDEHPFLAIDQLSLLTRGRLYYPYEKYQAKLFNYPPEIASDHLTGFWLTLDDFLQLCSDEPEIDWYDLAKPFWLAEITADDLQHLSSFEITQLVGAKQVVAMKNEQELMRGFVVTDAWLTQAYQNDQKLNKQT